MKYGTDPVKVNSSNFSDLLTFCSACMMRPKRFVQLVMFPGWVVFVFTGCWYAVEIT